MRRKVIPSLMLAVSVGVLVIDKTLLPKKFDGIDYKQLINEVTQNAMTSNVEVTAYGYEKKDGYTSLTISQGSGVIYDKIDDNYLVLSNNHVVYYDPQRYQVEYFITDYKGNRYEAELVKSSAEQDLALISFKDDYSMDLKPLELATKNPQVGDLVVSLGQPGGQKNSFTIGNVKSYRTINTGTAKEVSSVDFKVIKHSAPTAGGSSGGPLINESLQIVGINFAGDKVANPKEGHGYSIPILEVRRFLNK